MATLVLSSVGTALGGPVGAAIGALIGQSFDQQFLGSGSRGPRLGDLSIQTSSYGTQIPRIYGKMRVAGTVIWSTDLTEGAATTGAKGQPDTIYSYSVSFAVALSSRPVAGIGRVWADGKLIRDAAGAFKIPTVFRFYDGSEAQGLDPLIASIEGIGSTPAYRGLSLAVFENLELAEFGNRIPFITAEVLGDVTEPEIGAILNDAGAGVIACGDPRTVAGYAAHGPSIRAAVQPLVDAMSIQLLDDRFQLRTPSGDLIRIDADREFGASADEPAPRIQREPAAGSQVPTTLRLSYYDSARDCQLGEARASAGDELHFECQRELPAALSADKAKALAHEQLARAWTERDRVTLRVPTRHLGVKPGALLDLPLTPSRWLVERSTIEGFACVIEARPCLQRVMPVAAEAGRSPTRNPDAGQTVIALFEAPAIGASNERTLLLAGSSNGRGWRGKTVEVTVGPHRFVERTARRKSLLGRALTSLNPTEDSFEVEMVDPEHWLISCDDRSAAEGVNIAMLGDELVQFRDAEPIGPGRFRLGRLLRGRCGTDPASGSHFVGEFFVLLERDAVRPIALPGWLPPGKVRASIPLRITTLDQERADQANRPEHPMPSSTADGKVSEAENPKNLR